MSKQHTYITFPVSLLRDAFVDTQRTFSDILIIGHHRYVRKNKCSYKEAEELFALKDDDATFVARVSEIIKKTPAGEPYPNIKLSIAQEFATIEKSEQEVANLLMYIAIKSILGVAAVKKVTRNLILSRMFGYSSFKSMPKSLPEPQSELFKKYSTEYHFNKTLNELEYHWKLSKLNNKHLRARGIWIADRTKISLHDAMSKVLAVKRKDQILKAEKESAFNHAVNNLKKNSESLLPERTGCK